jgi:hypothetical protein
MTGDWTMRYAILLMIFLTGCKIADKIADSPTISTPITTPINTVIEKEAIHTDPGTITVNEGAIKLGILDKGVNIPVNIPVDIPENVVHTEPITITVSEGAVKVLDSLNIPKDFVHFEKDAINISLKIDKGAIGAMEVEKGAISISSSIIVIAICAIVLLFVAYIITKIRRHHAHRKSVDKDQHHGIIDWLF